MPLHLHSVVCCAGGAQVAPCTSNCVNGVEAAIDPATGTVLGVNAFDDVKAKWVARAHVACLACSV